MSETDFDPQSLLAEAMATFGLVFLSSMAYLQADAEKLDILGVSLANLLILSLMTYFAYEISGAHINPVVTVSLLLTRKIDLQSGFFYIISQLIGSLVAAILLQLVAGVDLLTAAAGKSELGFPHLVASYSSFQGILIEGILTFFLVFIYWAVAIDTKISDNLQGLAMGSIYGVNTLLAYSLTGAAMNPARVFGPAIVSLDFTHHWIYWVGPLIGAIIAAFFYLLIFLESGDSYLKRNH